MDLLISMLCRGPPLFFLLPPPLSSTGDGGYLRSPPCSTGRSQGGVLVEAEALPNTGVAFFFAEIELINRCLFVSS